MYEYEELTEIIGAYCSLVVPYRGYTERTVVSDYGNELVVRLTNGKEIIAYKDEVIVYNTPLNNCLTISKTSHYINKA